MLKYVLELPMLPTPLAFALMMLPTVMLPVPTVKLVPWIAEVITLPAATFPAVVMLPVADT